MQKAISTQISQHLWCAILLLACMVALTLAQTPSLPSDARGVIKLRVRVGDAKSKGLSRKRFFLIKGSLADNQALVQSIEQRPMVSRDCYYRSIGAGEALIAWLRQGDGCESVYCREVEAKDIEGPEAVPEFQQAALLGEKEFGSRELARKWLTVNLKDELRSGYYKKQQQDLQALLKQAEALSKAPVQSVMTNADGTAYFTNLEPGTYVISNLLPTEIGSSAAIWNCSIELKTEDLATEKAYLLANLGNRRDKNIKCPSTVEKPLPACPAASK